MIPETTYSTLRIASRKLATCSEEEINNALKNVAISLEKQKKLILEANRHDIERERQKGTKESLIDRLSLSEERLTAIINSLNSVIAQPSPIGKVVDGWTTPNGLKIEQVRVPIGVTAIIYESRPNVTIDAFALAYKSGNSILLRGSSSAINSNKAIVKAIKEGLSTSRNPNSLKVGIPEALELAPSIDHSEVDEIVTARGKIDLVLPRGSKRLIQTVLDKARVPVIETGSGVCHLYVDKTADIESAVKIAENAKLQRPGVCNAIETLLVHKDIINSFIPVLVETFLGRAQLRCDEQTLLIAKKAAVSSQNEATKNTDIIPATQEDFGYEFLDYILAIKTVNSVNEAIEHINKFNTKHSESIITQNMNNATKFQEEVDASCVYVNASTRFTDGEEFGFGTELGISTQKLHVRGPMGLQALTTTKYFIRGKGQIR
ncbi:MAG: glutamate-5-semialdehyde dehydrogenase [Treponema sp. CETP13]|nr:MAG: glutamate-5-semialdehyde dehydrogenase [Treponema sp. CETP13]